MLLWLSMLILKLEQLIKMLFCFWFKVKLMKCTVNAKKRLQLSSHLYNLTPKHHLFSLWARLGEQFYFKARKIIKQKSCSGQLY